MKEVLKATEKAVEELAKSTKQTVDETQNQSINDPAEKAVQETSRFMSHLAKNVDTEIDI